MSLITFPDIKNPNWHKRPRRWMPDRFLLLIQLRDQGKSDAEIAQALGVSKDAVKLTRKRYHVPGITAPDQPLSARQVASLLGLRSDSRSVLTWCREGWLPAERGSQAGCHPRWRITWDGLRVFLADPDQWHRYDPSRIAHPRLRQFAIQQRAGVQFLSTGEVAERMCVSLSAVHQWITKGWLRSYRNGNRFIREDDLARFALPQIGGYRERRAA